ncbi:MAG: NIL domain-containing protein [Candidatus Omnitrophica bacterium]|nr:NIL domain-containing protein [Candidatus Omnitrophota bacterium]
MKKKVELNIPSDFKDKPFFYQIIKNFDVIPKIIEASFSTQMGWAIVEFEGDKKELDCLFEYLRENGIQITPY